jgi:hypothetical protein
MKVISAKYLNEYTIEVTFQDKKKNVIDFLPQLKNNPLCKKYLDINQFIKFKIEQGNIVWGKDWEMIFTPESLYNNKLG